MRFEWDEAKNASNREKHGVSFEEAEVLLGAGVDYLESYDEKHSWGEHRYLAIGPISSGIVVVVWTERDENLGRIIGARMATRREIKMYREYLERIP